MLNSLKPLVVVLTFALIVFAIVKPICLRFMDASDFSRRRAVWFTLTCATFAAPSLWIYAAVAAARSQSDRKRVATFRTTTMKFKSTVLALTVLMCCASLAGFAARPSAKAADKGKAISLETTVPKAFGDWTELREQSIQVVNPQTQELLDKLYSQILTRTYVNKQGYRIMLSMAYGDDQRGGLQAHRPEVCYPAQGFKLGKVEDGVLPTAYGNIGVRRLATHLGARNEPVTYWLTVGDQVIKSALDKRIAQIRLGLTGQIPDGLLFRISSIDNDEPRAFQMQQSFAAEMMAAVPAPARKQLSGLVSTPADS